MWFGIQYIPEAERDRADGLHDAGDMVVVHVYKPEHLFTLASSPKSLPQLLEVVRLGALGAPATEPRCRHCDCPIDVPGLDELEAICASA